MIEFTNHACCGRKGLGVGLCHVDPIRQAQISKLASYSSMLYAMLLFDQREMMHLR